MPRNPGASWEYTREVTPRGVPTESATETETAWAGGNTGRGKGEKVG
jgi:hypothetical protein